MECVLKTVAEKAKHFFAKDDEYKYYKDEGGKWWIEIKVTKAPLVKRCRNAIVLAVTLDNGKGVKETDRGDYTLRDNDPIVDIPAKRVSWCIRFNKVTRRKDDYKYQIKITINGTTVVAPLIECLSKRKIPMRKRPREKSKSREQIPREERPPREKKNHKSREQIPRIDDKRPPTVAQVVPIDLESFIHDIVERRLSAFKQEWFEKEASRREVITNP